MTQVGDARFLGGSWLLTHQHQAGCRQPFAVRAHWADARRCGVCEVFPREAPGGGAVVPVVLDDLAAGRSANLATAWKVREGIAGSKWVFLPSLNVKCSPAA
jgi:hypothetical protein